MSAVWELAICIGVSWAGCGTWQLERYPSEESCYRALVAMRTGDQPIAESGNKRNTVAYCRPPQPDRKEKKQ